MKSIAQGLVTGGCVFLFGSGCATSIPGFHTQTPLPPTASNFSITLHCEPDDPLADWEARAQAATEEGILSGEDPEEILRADAAAPDDTCVNLLETMREGAEELHSEARYDRARNRF